MSCRRAPLLQFCPDLGRAPHPAFLTRSALIRCKTRGAFTRGGVWGATGRDRRRRPRRAAHRGARGRARRASRGRYPSRAPDTGYPSGRGRARRAVRGAGRGLGTRGHRTSRLVLASNARSAQPFRSGSTGAGAIAARCPRARAAPTQGPGHRANGASLPGINGPCHRHARRAISARVTLRAVPYRAGLSVSRSSSIGPSDRQGPGVS